jgi:hypothetical protein
MSDEPPPKVFMDHPNVPPPKDAVAYLFRRGEHCLSYETRLNPTGLGYELIVTNNGTDHMEWFADLSALLSREYALLQEWRAAGWRGDGPAYEALSGASPPPRGVVDEYEH